MLHEQFRKEGYVIIRGVLTPGQINDLRQLLNEEFIKEAESGRKTRRPAGTIIFKLPDIYRLLIDKKVVAPLQEIFGKNFVIIPDLIPQKDMCGDWHVDCASEIPGNYLLRPDYTFAKCGIYLQDNSREWGGGIDLVPRHHRFPVNFLGPKWAHKIKLLQNRIGIRLWGRMVDTKAGDMVVFDSRLPHRSTHPELLHTLPGVKLVGNTVKGMPLEKSKLSIYYNVCSKASEARDFMLNSVKRAAGETKPGREYPDEMPFTDCINFMFPDSFEREFVEGIEKLGLMMGCANTLAIKTL